MNEKKKKINYNLPPRRAGGIARENLNESRCPIPTKELDASLNHKIR
ncbi:hypothetical protein CZP2022_217 [Vibrio phage C-ZP2022]|nr:hypothetical protein CZP2022_217 [Vibrio phage C-ZP2022]